MNAWAGLVGAALGAAAGAGTPALIRRLPVPAADAGEPPVDYRRVAAAPALPGRLALVGALILGALVAVLPPWALAGAVPVALIAAGLGLVDLREHLLPDALLAPAAATVLAALAVTAGITGRWGGLLTAALVGAAFLAAFLLLALVAGGGFGLGDVKLAGLLGLVAGWLGIGTAVTSVVIAVAAGGVVTLALLVTRRIDRRSPIPFGPFLLFGWWAASLLTPVLVGPLPAS